jgi:acyl dehydratase
MELHESAARFASGTALGSTRWIKLPQHMLTEFEVLTLSNDPLHTDPDWVRRHTDFPSTIVPGFLTLSLLPWFLAQMDVAPTGFHALNYGLDRVRWTAPVPVDSELRAVFESAGAQPRSGGRPGYVVSFDVRVEVRDRDQPAMLARWLGAMVPDSDA